MPSTKSTQLFPMNVKIVCKRKIEICDLQIVTFVQKNEHFNEITGQRIRERPIGHIVHSKVAATIKVNIYQTIEEALKNLEVTDSRFAQNLTQINAKFEHCQR